MADTPADLAEALRQARACILTDRTALADTHMDPVTNRPDADGAAALVEYDAVLAKIDAALASTAAAPDRSQVYRLAVQHGLIPAAIPAGYVLVPVEPTPEMLNAANRARLYREYGPMDDPDVAQRRTFNSQQAWAAMLAAAPPHSPEGLT